jgi:hypothetical protein
MRTWHHEMNRFRMERDAREIDFLVRADFSSPWARLWERHSAGALMTPGAADRNSLSSFHLAAARESRSGLRVMAICLHNWQAESNSELIDSGHNGETVASASARTAAAQAGWSRQ